IMIHLFFVELLFAVRCALFLLIVVKVNHRPVLCPDVVALAVARGGIMRVPEYLQPLVVRDHLWVVGKFTDVRMARSAGTYLFIGRIFNGTAGISRLHL